MPRRGALASSRVVAAAGWAGMLLFVAGALCAAPAVASESDYDHLTARVSHSCDAPYELEITLSNNGDRPIEMLQGTMPWDPNPDHIRIDGREIRKGQPSRPLDAIGPIADYFGARTTIAAGKSVSGRLDLRYNHYHEGLKQLGETATWFKIDFPMPRKYPATPRFKDRVINVVVHGPTIELYVPAQRWWSKPCPVLTVVSPAI